MNAFAGSDSVGCRLGRSGSFTSLDSVSLARLVDDPLEQSGTVQRRLLGGYELTSSFGRAPAKFRLTTVVSNIASGSDKEAATAQHGQRDEGKSAGGMPLSYMHPAPRQHRPAFDPTVPCHAVCSLQNLGSKLTLTFERAVFVAGAAASAFDVTLGPRATMYWACGPSAGEVLQGNIGAVILTVRRRAGVITSLLSPRFTRGAGDEDSSGGGGGDLDAALGVPVAELLLTTCLPRFSADGVDCQLGPPGEFTSQDIASLKSVINAAPDRVGAGSFRSVDYQGLTATASFGRELVKFTIRSSSFESASAALVELASRDAENTGWAGPRPAAALQFAGLPCRLLNLSAAPLQLLRALLGSGAMHAAFDAVVEHGDMSGWCSAEPSLTGVDFG
eukprot:SAG31_NODE_10212_length_1170_cov_1.131653_1_plen_389_part_11